MTKIGVIYGSSRPSKAGEGIAEWVKSTVQLNDETTLEMIDLAELNLPLLAEPLPPMMGQYQTDSSKNWASKVEGLDAFIIVMSEYNAGYTAILKNAFDTLYNEWGGKKVAVISYGAGTASNASKQLKEVFERLKMEVSPTETHIHSIHDAQNEDGTLNEDFLKGAHAQEVLDSVL